MKILFLYNDPIHAWPLLRACDAAAEIGLDIEPHEEHSSQCFDQCRGGRHVNLIHQELVAEAAFESGRPVVILERIDGAQLGSSRRWISDASAIAKGFCLRPPQINNEYRGRVFAHLLRDAGVTGAKSCAVDGTPPQIAATDLPKIKPFYGFGAYQKQVELLDTKPDLAKGRSTAVHFAGTVEYSGTEVETHRRAAARICRRIRGGVGLCGRLQRPDVYRQSLIESRAVLSPFGWGEACYRDYEAWILGCVLIKPECDYVLGWPDMYRANETYLPCRFDLANVPELVERVRVDWKLLRPMRERCRKMAEDAAEPRRIAARLKEIMEAVI